MSKRWGIFFTCCLVFILGLSFTVYGTSKPKILKLSVNHAANDAPVELVIQGGRFYKNTIVKLTKAGQPEIVASEVRLISNSEISCTLDVRDRAVGSWDLVVANIGSITKKVKPTVLPNGFTIEYPAPIVTGVAPDRSENNSAVLLQVNGKGFRPGSSVILRSGQTEIKGAVKSASNQRIAAEFDLTGAVPGQYDLEVQNEDSKTAILAKGFTILAESTPAQPTALEVKSLTPNQGVNTGKIMVEITGANLSDDVSVKLSGNGRPEIPGLNIKAASSTKLSCFFDIQDQPAGKYDVVVSDPSGRSARLPDGFTVVAEARPVGKQLLPVFFDFDRAELRPDQLANLESNLKALQENPEWYVILGGHADERGSEEYNLGLTARRGQAVKDFLISRGIAAERIIIYAYGESYPAREGHNETAWRYNRRVDILEWNMILTREQVLSETKLD